VKEMAEIAEACPEPTRGNQREAKGREMPVQVASVDTHKRRLLHSGMRIGCPKSNLSTEPKLMAGSVLDV